MRLDVLTTKPLEDGLDAAGKPLFQRKSEPAFRRRAGHGCGGFTLLELVVVVTLISFLAVIALARLLSLQADAERVTVENVVGALRSALGMTVAESIVRGETPRLAALEAANPMDRLAEVPTNYRGEMDRVDPERLEDGNWYFDRSDRTLVYLVRNKANFSGGVKNLPQIRFKVTVVYTDRNRNGQRDAETETIEGLRLAPTEPYRWVQ